MADLNNIPEDQRDLFIAGIAKQGSPEEQKALVTKLPQIIGYVSDSLKVGVLLSLFASGDEELCNTVIASLPAVKDATPETRWATLIESALKTGSDETRQGLLSVIEHFFFTLVPEAEQKRFLMRLDNSDHEDVQKTAAWLGDISIQRQRTKLAMSLGTRGTPSLSGIYPQGM